jgi:hypothetical protein
MRLCAVTHVDALKCPQHSLLPMPRFRRLATPRRPVCDNRPVRQDLLDQIVWTEVIRLLEDPSLIQSELDRRLMAARSADPAKQRDKALQRELTRTRKSMDRLLTAYQEDLLSLDELRRRMPELRQREHALQTELHSILDQINDRAVYLRLAETLSAFLARLRASADGTPTHRPPRHQGDPDRGRDHRHPALHPSLLHAAEWQRPPVHALNAGSPC